MGNKILSVIKQLWAIRPPIITALAVFLALPLAIMTDGKEMKTAYVLLVMACLWLTEAIPIPVTSLLPIVLFPTVGVLPAADVSKNYINDTSMLFMGGLIVAVAVEEWNLHKRIALGVLRIVGSDPKFIMAGLMLPTWFLSMWISNTATTSMMIPIVQAVLVQLKGDTKSDKQRQIKENAVFEMGDKTAETTETSLPDQSEGNTPVKNAKWVMENTDTGKEIQEPNPDPISSDVIHTEINDVTLKSPTKIIGVNDDEMPEKDIHHSYSLQQAPESDVHDVEYKRLCKGLSLCVAYAANVGGIATLTGSPPNLVLKGQADQLFKRYGGDSGINFANFMSMAVPLSIMMLVICWCWLFILFIRCNHCCHQDPERKAAVTKAIQAQFRAMGRISFAEIVILIMFILFAVMLLTRSSANFPGWGGWFTEGYVTDSSTAIFISILLFVLPAKMPTVFCWRYDEEGIKQPPKYTPILKWPMVHAKLPWGVLVLLGGGFALADACKTSGLSELVGRNLESFRNLDPLVANLLFALVVAMATEVTSNTATATLLLPIVAELEKHTAIPSLEGFGKNFQLERMIFPNLSRAGMASIKVGANPLYLMMTTALATSFAFMLPVATPPNAIVFSHGHLRIPDMAVAGLMMNVIAVLCLVLCMSTWATSIYDLNTMPAIFGNTTTAVTSRV